MRLLISSLQLEKMKSIISFILIFITYNSIGQIPNNFEYPDTLWVYGNTIDSLYGFNPENPIKVGGGILPKNIYRYLNNLLDINGKEVTYKRVGSCCGDEINRKKPLTKFNIKNDDKELEIYFDQYEWDYPKLINRFQWNENRKGYHGELKKDTIFHGYGLYFFEDGGYYKGNWKDGIMNGKGEMLIIDQEKYVGEFKNGEYHGIGILAYPDGGSYQGNWSNGKKEGKGKIYYPPDSGIEYIEGEFKNDEPKGTFIIYKSDKSQETYEF